MVPGGYLLVHDLAKLVVQLLKLVDLILVILVRIIPGGLQQLLQQVLVTLQRTLHPLSESQVAGRLLILENLRIREVRVLRVLENVVNPAILNLSLRLLDSIQGLVLRVRVLLLLLLLFLRVLGNFLLPGLLID